MRETLTSDNRRDFTQRYSHSYGYFIRDNGERLPVFIADVDDDGAYFQTLDGTQFTARCDGGANFEFAQIAKRNWLGMDGNLYHTHRVPQRQWQRGISNGNTAISLLTLAGPVPVEVSNTVMRNILFENKTNKVGANTLLSEQFAIAGEIVYLYDMVIGTFNNNTVFLKSKYSIFEQELCDVCKKQGIEVKNA